MQATLQTSIDALSALVASKGSSHALEYIPIDLLHALNTAHSFDVPNVPGLRVANAAREFGDVLPTEALSLLARVFRKTLDFKNPLSHLMAHRKMKRAAVAAAGAVAAAAGQTKLSNVALDDGSAVLAPRADTSAIRDDGSWRVKEVPQCFKTFHDVICGPPTPSFVASALSSTVSMTMIDFEDSMTFTLDNQMNGLRTVTKAAARTLKFDLEGATIDLSACEKTSQILIRMEGLALPNPHFLVDSIPVPMHLVTVVLFLFHNWQNILKNGHVPAFYIPKLETMEEAAYCAELFSCVENELASEKNAYPVGSLRCFVIMENVWSAFQKDEILHALRDYVVGMNAGWHDYCASVGAAHASLPLFTMPPKKNLRLVVEHLHDYHLGIVNACMKRGAIPIGGMNGMVPPPAWAGGGPDPTALSRIRECFEADFWVQVKRGLRGVWMADAAMAPLMRSLIEKAREQGQLEDSAVPSYTPAPDKMLVAHLQPFEATYTDLVQNVSDAVQYLASFLAGNGNPGLTALHPDGVAVRNMEDAATLERSRREIWAMVTHSKPTLQPDGSSGVASRELVEQAIEQVMRDINHRGGDADVPLVQLTKPHYDTALLLLKHLVFAAVPVDYFSVLALRFCVAPARADSYFLGDCFAAASKPWILGPNLATSAKVVSATDEAFQPASDLLRAHYPQFHPRSFAKSGQLYDGWETRRHNLQPPDSATIMLCCPTTVVGVDVCTANFSGNHSQAASVLGLLADENTSSSPRWVELLPPTETAGNSSNLFDCVAQAPVIAVTLRMYPDGGIARLRIFGREHESFSALARPAPGLMSKISQVAADNSRRLLPEEIQAKREAYVKKVAETHGVGVGKRVHPSVMIHDPPRPRAAHAAASASSVDCGGLREVAALASGGRSIACSNRHYSDSSNLIQGGRAVNMGDGWETRRARAASVVDVVALDGPVMQYQWAAFALAETCCPAVLVLDTEWNPNNSPVCASVEWQCAAGDVDAASVVTGEWQPLVPPSLLQPCEENVFRLPPHTVSHLLIKTYPCGGLCRLKVFAAAQ